MDYSSVETLQSLCCEGVQSREQFLSARLHLSFDKREILRCFKCKDLFLLFVLVCVCIGGREGTGSLLELELRQL